MYNRKFKSLFDLLEIGSDFLFCKFSNVPMYYKKNLIEQATSNLFVDLFFVALVPFIYITKRKTDPSALGPRVRPTVFKLIKFN